MNGVEVLLPNLTYESASLGFTQDDFDSRGRGGPTGATTNLGILPFRAISIGGNVDIIDDLYILDGSGSAPWNDFLGDVEIGVIRPNGVGDQDDFTPSGAATNWEAIDDTTPDDDTTHNAGASVGMKDLVQMEDVSLTSGIFGAQFLVSAKRSNDGLASMVPILKQSGVEYPGTEWALGNTYHYRLREIYENSPGGAAWTPTILNAIQAGYERKV